MRVRRLIRFSIRSTQRFEGLRFDTASENRLQVMAEILVSVIIPTFNRSSQIVDCLEELAKQMSPYDDVEVIVVDNGSKDDTKQAVGVFIERNGGDIKYVLEETPGVNSARNRGRTVASGKAIALLDDDAIPRPKWLELTREYFLNGEGDCFAGRVEVGPSVMVPAWLPPEMYSILGKSFYGAHDRKLNANEYPQSGNCAFTAEMFDDVGGFNPRSILYGDETEFFQRAREKGYSFEYRHAIVIDHCPAADRLTEEAVLEKGYAWGKGSAVNWLLTTPSSFERTKRILEFSTRTIYIATRKRMSPSFSREYTYRHCSGHLAQLVKGL